MKIFDRQFHFNQLQRAQKLIHHPNFIHNNVSENIYDRLKILNRKFEKVLVLGYLNCDLQAFTNNVTQYQYTDYDEEDLSNFKDKFDLIISVLSLHYVNDIPGALSQHLKLLNKDGIFIGTFLGGDTLNELRVALQEAEIALFSGVSPRVIPMVSVKDAARLIQRVGFEMPISDSDIIEARYRNLKDLLTDLKNLGQSNALLDRNKSNPGKEFFLEAEKSYRKNFSKEETLAATFEIITITGALK